MKFRGKRALRAAFPGDTSIVQVRIITKQDGEIDVEGPVSEDEATAIFKLAAGSPLDTRAEEAACVEAAMAWECARKPLLVVTQLRDDERIRLAQSQLDTSVALERAVRVLLLAKRGG